MQEKYCSLSFQVRYYAGVGNLKHRTVNRVKILFTAVGNEDDLIESANSFTIHPLLLTHEELMLPLPRMVAHQTDRQRARSA
jgi:hypothetical protein